MTTPGASRQGTQTYARNHPGSAFNMLGSTGLTVSQAGFGVTAYRRRQRSMARLWAWP